MRICLASVCLLWFGALVLRADTHYVRTPETCTNTVLQSPYTNWDTAATQIQWAVSAAGSGDTVLISNGVYVLTNNYISLTGNLTVQSVNGPAATIIDGNYPLFSNRCFYLSGAGETRIISGLTISNCYKADGWAGAIYVASGNAVITNCVFTSNRCNAGAGAIYIGSSVSTGIVANCVFSNNYANLGGGAYIEATNMVVQSCTFVGNVITGQTEGTGGGGLYISAAAEAELSIVRDSVFQNNIASALGGGLMCVAGVVSNCTIINNIVTSNTVWNSGGAGGYMRRGIIRNCTITGNNSATYGGGVWMAAYIGNDTGAVQNCLITGNAASNQSGGIHVYSLDSDKTNNYAIENCTVVSNRAVKNAGGMRVAASFSGYTNCTFVRNCIVASNSAPSNPDIYASSGTNAYFFCCSPAFAYFRPNQGNITNDPRFADPVSGNWRLNANSPCINAGTNRDWMEGALDLDGRKRIRYGTVDMGAYERINDGTIYGAW